MKRYEFYKHTSRTSGKSYIGITSKTMEERWKGHLNEALNLNSEWHFHRAIRMYGQHDFTHELLESAELTKDSAGLREKEWIQMYNTFNNGYNMTEGGFLPPNHAGRITINKDGVGKSIYPEEFLEYQNKGWVLGNKLKGLVVVHKNSEYKRIPPNALPEYQRDGWARGLQTDAFRWIKSGNDCFRVSSENLDSYIEQGWDIGRPRFSAEHAKNISERTRGENNPFYGEEHTKETKTLISKANSDGLYITPKGTFVSAKKAGSENNVSDSTIMQRCKNPDKIVKGNQYTNPDYIGKTWKQNGYYFIPKHNVPNWDEMFK